jgi:hypothetical protein
MSQRRSILRRGAYDVNDAEFGLVCQCNVEDDIGEPMLRVDFDFRFHIGLKISLLLKECGQGLPVLFHIGCNEWRLDWIVGNLNQSGIGKSRGPRELEDSEVHGGFQYEQDTNPIGLGFNLNPYPVALPGSLECGCGPIDFVF